MSDFVRVPAMSVVTICLLTIIAGTLSANLLAAGGSNRAARADANDEAWLKTEVREQLVTLPFYSVFDNLQYGVDGTNVSISGQVVKPVLKSDAERAVKAIPGVGTVDNQVEVLPLSPNDDRIRQAEYRAIYSFPSLQMYALRAVPPIHIIVKNGNVTLTGIVANQAHKDTAGIRAKTVSGVFSVTNNLAVEQKSE
jgi:hyperosmotically inducible protein